MILTRARMERNFQASTAQICALGLRRAAPGERGASINGVLFPAPDDLAAFDARENGYARVEVAREHVELLGWHVLPAAARARHAAPGPMLVTSCAPLRTVVSSTPPSTSLSADAPAMTQPMAAATKGAADAATCNSVGEKGGMDAATGKSVGPKGSTGRGIRRICGAQGEHRTWTLANLWGPREAPDAGTCKSVRRIERIQGPRGQLGA